MSKMQPFRDETMTRTEDLRVRLNELVSVVNERSRRWRAIRIPNVQKDMVVTLANPGFPVTAIVVGGVRPTNGGVPINAAPWMDWTQQADGRIVFSFTDGLEAGGKLYAVNVVLFEGEAS